MARTIFIGMDQASGRNSDFGVAIIEPDTLQIIEAIQFKPRVPKTSPVELRIIDITQQIDAFLTPVIDECIRANIHIVAATEQFIMRGKGGESLAWAVGAILTCFPCNPDYVTFIRVNNLYAKRNAFGSGKADKSQVLSGLINVFGGNPDSVSFLQQLGQDGKEDAIDAVSIALGASVKYRLEAAKVVSSHKTKTKSNKSKK